MTFEIICKCLMGDHNNDSQSSPLPVLAAIDDLSDMILWRIKNILLVKLLKLVPFGDKILIHFAPAMIKGHQAINVRDEFIQKQIESAKERIANGDETFDLNSLLLKSGKFSKGEIHCQVYTFLFAGHETTASALQWALYFVGEHSEWSDKISDEFDSIGRTISAKTLKKVPITDAFIKETLRVAHVVDQYIKRKLMVVLTSYFTESRRRLFVLSLIFDQYLLYM